MGSPHSATHHHLVSVCEAVFDIDMHVGKDASEMMPESFEGFSPRDFVSLGIDQTVSNHIRSGHFVDGFDASLVPNFFKPPMQ
jgi:hypothetical protein